MADKTGGAAFPHNENHDDGTHWHSHAGMTLRDYFAAKAMAHYFGTGSPESRAKAAYAEADAMLAARGDA